MKTFDYINRVNLMLPLSVYEGTWTHCPPLVAMHLLDRSCVIVGNFLKLQAMFPKKYLSLLCCITLSSSREKPTQAQEVAAVSSMNMIAHNSLCSTRAYHLCIDLTQMPLLGNVSCTFKQIPTITQDLSRRCITTRGESVFTYPCRPKAEALG